MHYEDLTEYKYSAFPEKLKASRGLSDNVTFLNIGWLSGSYPFTTGHVSDDFLHKVFRLCRNAENMFRGFHMCDVCPEIVAVPSEKSEGGITHVNRRYNLIRTCEIYKGETLWLGAKEICVAHKDIAYIAPDMICHYIRNHSYLPPNGFIEAVLSHE